MGRGGGGQDMGGGVEVSGGDPYLLASRVSCSCNQKPQINLAKM